MQRPGRLPRLVDHRGDPGARRRGVLQPAHQLRRLLRDRQLRLADRRGVRPGRVRPGAQPARADGPGVRQRHRAARRAGPRLTGRRRRRLPLPVRVLRRDADLRLRRGRRVPGPDPGPPRRLAEPAHLPILGRQRMVAVRDRRRPGGLGDRRHPAARHLGGGLRRPRAGHGRADQPGRGLRTVAGPVAGRAVAAGPHREGAVRLEPPERGGRPVPRPDRPSGTQHPQPGAHLLFQSGKRPRRSVCLFVVMSRTLYLPVGNFLGLEPRRPRAGRCAPEEDLR